MIVLTKTFSLPPRPGTISEAEERFGNKLINWFKDRSNKKRQEKFKENLEDIADSKKEIKRSIRKSRGINSRESEAKLRALNKEEFNLRYKNRMENRKFDRERELSDIKRARALDAKNGTGSNFKNRLEDLKISAKHKIQDLSDQYYGSTGGRNLAGDAALATAGLAGGYLAYKAIKKAKYDREQAKKAAEEKFKR